MVLNRELDTRFGKNIGLNDGRSDSHPCFQVRVNQFFGLKLFCCYRIRISLERGILCIPPCFMCQEFGMIFFSSVSLDWGTSREPCRKIYLYVLELGGHSILLLKPWLKCLNVYCQSIRVHKERNCISTEDDYMEYVFVWSDSGLLWGISGLELS